MHSHTHNTNIQSNTHIATHIQQHAHAQPFTSRSMTTHNINIGTSSIYNITDNMFHTCQNRHTTIHNNTTFSIMHTNHQLVNTTTHTLHTHASPKHTLSLSRLISKTSTSLQYSPNASHDTAIHIIHTTRHL